MVVGRERRLSTDDFKTVLAAATQAARTATQNIRRGESRAANVSTVAEAASYTPTDDVVDDFLPQVHVQMRAKPITVRSPEHRMSLANPVYESPESLVEQINALPNLPRLQTTDLTKDLFGMSAATPYTNKSATLVRGQSPNRADTCSSITTPDTPASTYDADANNVALAKCATMQKGRGKRAVYDAASTTNRAPYGGAVASSTAQLDDSSASPHAYDMATDDVNTIILAGDDAPQAVVAAHHQRSLDPLYEEIHTVLQVQQQTKRRQQDHPHLVVDAPTNAARACNRSGSGSTYTIPESRETNYGALPHPHRDGHISSSTPPTAHMRQLQSQTSNSGCSVLDIDTLFDVTTETSAARESVYHDPVLIKDALTTSL